MQLIPNAFVRLPQLQGRIPEDVILRNASGRVWHVKTRYVGEKLYFDDGWRAFHQENCLGQADFLVFKLERRKQFKVGDDGNILFDEEELKMILGFKRGEDYIEVVLG